MDYRWITWRTSRQSRGGDAQCISDWFLAHVLPHLGDRVGLPVRKRGIARCRNTLHGIRRCSLGLLRTGMVMEKRSAALPLILERSPRCNSFGQRCCRNEGGLSIGNRRCETRCGEQEAQHRKRYKTECENDLPRPDSPADSGSHAWPPHSGHMARVLRCRNAAPYSRCVPALVSKFL